MCDKYSIAVRAFFVILLYALIFAYVMLPKKRIRLKAPKGKEEVKKIIFYVIVLGILLRLPYLFILSTTDEIQFVLAAKLITQGIHPYIDFYYDHPPLYPYIASSIMKVLGTGIIQAKLFPFILSAISVWLLYAVSKRHYGTYGALAATAVFSLSPTVSIYTPTANQYSGLVFFTLLSYFFLLRAFERNDALNYILCGISCGLATMFKGFGPLLAVSILMATIWRGGISWKNRLLLVAGFTATIVAITILFFSYDMIYFVYIARATYVGASLLEKLKIFIFEVAPMGAVEVCAAVLGAKLMKKKTIFDWVVMVHGCLTAVFILLLNYENSYNPQMYLTYLMIPASLLSAGLGPVLKKGVDLNPYLCLFVATLLFSQAAYPIVANAEYTYHGLSAAYEMEKYGGRDYVGDPTVPFLGDLQMRRDFFVLFKNRLTSGDISRSDFFNLPNGTMFGDSVVFDSLFERVWKDFNNTRDMEFNLVYNNTAFRIYEKK